MGFHHRTCWAPDCNETVYGRGNKYCEKHYEMNQEKTVSEFDEKAFKITQLESQLNEGRQALSRVHTFLRNTATDLEDGKDGLTVADDIHEALGDGRPNGTTDEEEEDES